MSHCMVPNWNLVPEQVEGEERNIISPHVQPQQNITCTIPVANCELAELTWENGQLGLHGFGGNLSHHPHQTNPTWSGPKDTLESMVHRASFSNFSPSDSGQEAKRLYGKWWENSGAETHNEQNKNGNLSGKWKENSSHMLHVDQEYRGGKNFQVEENARNRDDNTHSACYNCSENQDEERSTKVERVSSQSLTKRSHATAVHNQSERRRRDRINEKIKALQKLVPNARKTDKASMLDEVIEHIKQLQAQIQLMSSARNTPQIMMPLGMQQQLEMSRMAMGMGVINVNNLAQNAPQFFPPFVNASWASLYGSVPPFASPPFVMSPGVPPLAQLKANFDATGMNNFVYSNDAYSSFATQPSMAMDFFHPMSALSRQQSHQPSKKTINLSRPNEGLGK